MELTFLGSGDLFLGQEQKSGVPKYKAHSIQKLFPNYRKFSILQLHRKHTNQPRG